MEHWHKPHIFSSFIFGAILGSIAVFFMNTKQGKKVLKKLTKEDRDGVSDLKKLVSEEIDDEIKPKIKKLTEKITARLKEEEIPIKKTPVNSSKK